MPKLTIRFDVLFAGKVCGLFQQLTVCLLQSQFRYGILEIEGMGSLIQNEEVVCEETVRPFFQKVNR